jgi:hypothetical protein
MSVPQASRPTAHGRRIPLVAARGVSPRIEFLASRERHPADAARLMNRCWKNDALLSQAHPLERRPPPSLSKLRTAAEPSDLPSMQKLPGATPGPDTERTVTPGEILTT